VENLARSRHALEIDASGRIVLPAFVDPDAVLVMPPPSVKNASLKVLSLRRLEIAAAATAAERARAGTLTVGAHTGYAPDLRDSVKVLRIHQALQGKPLRIRSILSPPPKILAEKWLPAIRERKLAGMLELAADGGASVSNFELFRSLATVAAALGYSVRLRANGLLDPEILEFATGAGVVSVVAPSGFACPGALADMGCVHVIPMPEAFREDRNQRVSVRKAIDAGTPIALGSGYGSNGSAAFNPQFLLHLACDRFGLTCEEAIVATTHNAACALRLSHVAGSFDPGKAADLVVMDVPDYHELARRVGHSDAEMVMRAGQPVYRRAPVTPD
jgi:imidazolonepropionase